MTRTRNLNCSLRKTVDLSSRISFAPHLLFSVSYMLILAVLELVRQVVYDILQQLSMLDITGLSKGVINVANGVARAIITTLIQVNTATIQLSLCMIRR